MGASPTIPLLYFLMPLAMFFVGGVLAWRGLRGRAIDNHPICRRCGFDLYALDNAERCPECGTELSASRIRLGHRARRPVPLTIGISLMLPAVLLLAAISYAALKHLDINRYK